MRRICAPAALIVALPLFAIAASAIEFSAADKKDLESSDAGRKAMEVIVNAAMQIESLEHGVSGLLTRMHSLRYELYQREYARVHGHKISDEYDVALRDLANGDDRHWRAAGLITAFDEKEFKNFVGQWGFPAPERTSPGNVAQLTKAYTTTKILLKLIEHVDVPADLITARVSSADIRKLAGEATSNQTPGWEELRRQAKIAREKAKK
jgi:hypothetical protein